ncbi:acetolactate synthase small subunit [Myroides sp. LJL116]
MQNNVYTLNIYTQDSREMLNRIVNVFSRRNLKIKSIRFCDSTSGKMQKYNMQVVCSLEQIQKICLQIERFIDVYKVFYYGQSDVVSQELALYKLNFNPIVQEDLQEVLFANKARVIQKDNCFVVVEKTGSSFENKALLEQLKSFGVLEFTQSTPIVITRENQEINQYL